MKLKVLASGSAGNAYALYNKFGDILLLDLGIKYQKILQGIDFCVFNVAGAVVSHVHRDHALAVKDIERLGIKVFKPYLENEEIQKIKYGEFKIYAFPVPHDGTSNYGFLIEADGERFLYVTDFEYIKYNFKSMNINHMLIAMNYDKDLIDSDAANWEHVIRGHPEKDTTLKFIEENDTKSLQNVIICHLSEFNADSREFTEEVKRTAKTAKYVNYARKGLEIDL